MNRWISITALSLALAASGLSALQGSAAQQTKDKRMPASNAGREKIEIVDLHSRIRAMPLREGLNRIHTFRNGLRLSARVKGGQTVEYVATDSLGNIVSVTVFKRRVREDSEKRRWEELKQAAQKHEERDKAEREALEKLFEQAAAGQVNKGCWVCAEVQDADGNYVSCIYLECPKG